MSASRIGSCARTAVRWPWPGLWAGWRDPSSDPESPLVVRTFTIVTTTPNDALADLHDRMPVIVPDDAWQRWLDPDTGRSW